MEQIDRRLMRTIDLEGLFGFCNEWRALPFEVGDLWPQFLIQLILSQSHDRQV
jgi:hypothetical protein